ncbi:hypothetical protein NC652_033077 [Populus alba x Populus x berolinensis]|uniref:Uncharacterized protein n=1 Tax=Populus alba x Populus x berolinensis TaxID=444605 RepID=A0AAD6PYM8_9ROSI|nr:hypothetical protein NC652_033077 [Populus alba x Populus x berolinensis]KAJ6972594.1 hypothetical protein NC653_033023 [Populus alba x Populus x berolinensis]
MGMTQGDGTYLEGDLALEGTGEDWKLDVEWHMSPENDGVGLYMELGATLWHTRKARNQRIFRERAEFQSSPICNIRSGMAADINRSLVKTLSGMEISLADGCSKGNNESAGAGG